MDKECMVGRKEHLERRAGPLLCRVKVLVIFS